MPILNYTTQIAAEKTCTQIQKLLAGAGASSIMNEYSDGVLIGISFRISINNQLIAFRMPAQIDKIYVILQNDRGVPRKLKSREQASRVAWRIIKDWIEAQLAIVEAEQAEMVEVFLPYAQDPKSGRTMYSIVKDAGFKQLTHQGE